MQELVASFFSVSSASAWLNTSCLPLRISPEFLANPLGVLEKSCPPAPLGRALHPPVSPSPHLYIPVHLHEHLVFGIALGPVVPPPPSSGKTPPTPVVTRFVLDSGRRAALLFSYLSDNTIAVSIDLFDQLGDRLAETTYFARRPVLQAFPSEVVSRLKLLHKRDCPSCTQRDVPCVCRNRLEEALAHVKRIRRRRPQSGGERIDGPGFALRRHPFWLQQLEQFVESRLGSYVVQVSSTSPKGEAVFSVAFRAKFKRMSTQAATMFVRTALYEQGVQPTVVPPLCGFSTGATVSVNAQNNVSTCIGSGKVQPNMMQHDKECGRRELVSDVACREAKGRDVSAESKQMASGFTTSASVDAVNRMACTVKEKTSSGDDVLSTSSPVSELYGTNLLPLHVSPDIDDRPVMGHASQDDKHVTRSICVRNGCMDKIGHVDLKRISNNGDENEECSNPAAQVCPPGSGYLPGPSCAPVRKPGVVAVCDMTLGGDVEESKDVVDEAEERLSLCRKDCPSDRLCCPLMVTCPPGQSCLSGESCLPGVGVGHEVCVDDTGTAGCDVEGIGNKCGAADVQDKMQNTQTIENGACAVVNMESGLCCPVVTVAEPEDPNTEWMLPSRAADRPELGSMVWNGKRKRRETRGDAFDGDEYDGDDEESDDRPPSPCMCIPKEGEEHIVDTITGFVHVGRHAIVESNCYAVKRWEHRKRRRKRDGSV